MHLASAADIREFGRIAQAINSERWRIVICGAGLPKLREQVLDEAPTYATRFDFKTVTALDAPDTKAAFAVPLIETGIQIDADALDSLCDLAGGYPYFIQLYGRHVCDHAERAHIHRRHVEAANRDVMASLDAGVYGAAWQRLRPSDRQFALAMARLDTASVPVAAISTALRQSVKTLSPIRQRLIDSGVVEPAGHGLLRFSWPGFARYVAFKHPSGESDIRDRPV